MSGRLDPEEFTAGFVAEAGDLVRAGSAGLLAVETALKRGAPAPGRAVRDVFRAVHTVKGLAAMAGVEPIVAIAHRMEAGLRLADRGETMLAPAAVDALLEGFREIGTRLQAVAARDPIAPPPARLLELLDAAAADGGPGGAAGTAARPALALEPALAARLARFEVEQLEAGAREGRRGVRVDFAPSPERAAEGLDVTTVRERLQRLGDLVRVFPIARPPGPDAPGGLVFALLLSTGAPDEALAAAAGVRPEAVRTILPGGQPAAPRAEEAAREGDLAVGRPSLVRVAVAKLDDAMERMGALTVTRYRLSRAVADLAAKGADTRELGEIVKDHARQIRDLRAAILRIRMVPAAEILERIPLVLRGLRQTTGKQVRLEVDAGRAELDKGVAERIFPAIVHILRNAVDHAIETPEERRAAGKPEEGLIRVSCFERSNARLELAIEDDGRGIDQARLAARAGRPMPTTEAALLDLVSLPGLSTRDEASTTSGRGLGMDIVRRIVVDELGGELRLRTASGRGTAVTLRVPLTIAIIDAFTLECAAQRFAVPVSAIEEIIEVDEARIVAPPDGAAGGPGGARIRMIERRGRAIPLIRLESVFRLGAEARGGKALVVRRGGRPVAFAVDRMLGRQEVVVRPLEDRLVRAPGISGATDLGEGRPTLVIDLPALGARLAADAPAEARP